MNPALYERLGVRNSLGALAGLLVAALGTAFLLIGVWAFAREGGSDSVAVFGDFADDVTAIGRSLGKSIDALAGIIVTLLLGFYVAVIGGQFSPGLDVVSLRSRLSLAAQVLAVCFCCIAGFRIVALAEDRAAGAILVIVLETVVVVALAIELTSWILLSRERQLEQNLLVIDRSRARIRRAAGLLDRCARKHPIRASIGAVTSTAAPALVLAAIAPGARWLFVPFVLALVLAAHGTFFIVHWSRAGEGLGRLSWSAIVAPVFVGLIIVLSAMQLFIAHIPWAGAAVLCSFLVVAVTEMSVRGRVRTLLSLRHLAARLELGDAIQSRRRAFVRVQALGAVEAVPDEEALLTWLRRP